MNVQSVQNVTHFCLEHGHGNTKMVDGIVDKALLYTDQPHVSHTDSVSNHQDPWLFCDELCAA